MAETSNIEWTDSTFNPWEGCQKVGPGCDHCYAEHRNARFGGGVAVNWGPGAPRRRTSAANWRKPVQWEREHEAFFAEHGRRRRVFCASLADVFDNEVPPEWRSDLFDLIRATPNLDWLLLTKRVGNALGMLPCDFSGGRYTNVWIGATIVNRDEMLRDGPKLAAINARWHFWSVEPMLGDLGAIPQDLMPDWVICGGESGPKARPMRPEWARSLRDQCAAAGVPFLFKQWGEWLPGENAPHPLMTERDGSVRLVAHHQDGRWGSTDTKVNNANYVRWDDAGTPHVGAASNGPYFRPKAWAEKVGKKAAGRLLDGRTHDGFPEVTA